MTSPTGIPPVDDVTRARMRRMFGGEQSDAVRHHVDDAVAAQLAYNEAFSTAVDLVISNLVGAIDSFRTAGIGPSSDEGFEDAMSFARAMASGIVDELIQRRLEEATEEPTEEAPGEPT